ncbi:MAG: hypothetical protein U0103_15200 [Candidatus Obscuribacterales bacterium]
MAIHPAEVDRSFVKDHAQPIAQAGLAASSLADVSAARTAMSGASMPAAFGNFSIASDRSNTNGDAPVRMAQASGESRFVISSPGGAGSDCGKVAPGPNGTVIVKPGPNGCDVGNVTYRKGPDGKTVLEVPTPDSGVPHMEY